MTARPAPATLAAPSWQEALYLAAARMDEGHYRGFQISYAPNCNRLDFSYVDLQDGENPARQGLAPTAAAARRAVDDLIDGDER